MANLERQEMSVEEVQKMLEQSGLKINKYQAELILKFLLKLTEIIISNGMLSL